MLGHTFNIMAFPAGPKCNLNCEYCYYLDKIKLYPNTNNFMMSYQILKMYIKQYVEAYSGSDINFIWQGGEPTLRGLKFFKKAVELEKKYMPKHLSIHNNFQTNGILIDQQWANFFLREDFLVGLSIDGPDYIHDQYRRDKQGNPTHKRVMKSLKVLKTYNIKYNVLCVVNNLNVKKPTQIYNFFKKKKIRYLQFIPLVETDQKGKISKRTVQPENYKKFLIELFNEWILNDYGNIYIQFFEECVKAWLGIKTNLCTVSEYCANNFALEHNGDLYSCDHYVYLKNKLGNIQDKKIVDLIHSSKQFKFAELKISELPEVCRECKYFFVCHGGCPKNRLKEYKSSGKKINYLCEAYKGFFNYAFPYFESMANGIRLCKKPTEIQSELIKIYKDYEDKCDSNCCFFN